MECKIETDNIYLPALKLGTKLRFFTHNSEYNIKKVSETCVFVLNGGTYFPKDSLVKINGTTFGGSMIRAKQLAQGVVEIMYNGKMIRTSWCNKVEYIID